MTDTSGQLLSLSTHDKGTDMDISERVRLIERYGAGPAELRAAWGDVPESPRTWRPAESEWSAHEIVIHCADSETYAATRIRLLTAEPNPVITGYDQERWATTFAYHDQSVETALLVVDAVRAHTLQMIRALADEQWESSGTHSESGPYSADDWLRIYAAHVHDHAEQIRANIAAWQPG